jgi:hypothetical protein
MIRFNVVLEDADKSKKSYEKFYACGVYDKCDG